MRYFAADAGAFLLAGLLVAGLTVPAETREESVDSLPQRTAPEPAAEAESTADTEPAPQPAAQPRATPQPAKPRRRRAEPAPMRIPAASAPLPRPKPEVTVEAPTPVEQQLNETVLPPLGEPGAEPVVVEEPEVVEARELPKFELTLSARLTENSDYLSSGLLWRVFTTKPGEDGSFAMLATSDSASPNFELEGGDYIVHVAYGLASTARRVTIADEPTAEEMTINAGGLRLKAVGLDAEPLVAKHVRFDVHSSEQDEYGQRKLVVQNATPEQIVRLNPGTYHVVAVYGDANAVIRADVRVQPGKLTDATVQHKAAAVTLKLVNEPGSEALANTEWSILSPGGDVVKESSGAFPTHVLAEGEYSVIARNDGRLYNRDFSVEAGLDREVELVASAAAN